MTKGKEVIAKLQAAEMLKRLVELCEAVYHEIDLSTCGTRLRKAMQNAQSALNASSTIETMDFSGVPIRDGTALDYPTAWAIQKEVGASLEHHPRCSCVRGWDPISGPHMLCDCGAIEREWLQRQAREGGAH